MVHGDYQGQWPERSAAMQLFLITAPVTVEVQDGPLPGDVSEITTMVPVSPCITVCGTEDDARAEAARLGPEFGYERI
jgi:hypothetical protein